MGATEILQALEKGEELTSVEIANKIKCSIAAAQQSIKRLLKDVSENVEVRILTSDEKEEKYGRKVGCKIYVYRINE